MNRTQRTRARIGFPVSAAARAFAAFLALSTLAELARAPRTAGSAESLLWIDLRSLPGPLPGLALLAASTVLLAYAVRPRLGRWRKAGTLAVVGLLGAGVGWNALVYGRLLANGTLHEGPALSASLCVAGGLALVAAGIARGPSARPVLELLVASAHVRLYAVLGPLVLFATFGRTDYRRPADAVVVLGARAYADGRPSHALADRVRTACRLYREGLAPYLLLSGGPGDGVTHEPEAARALAVAEGVPPEAILLDREGLSTGATARNAARIAEERGWGSVLVVSHGYHLPRVDLACRRAGLRAYTVPAHENRRLARLPYYAAREVAALWVYWLRPRAAQ